MEKKHQELVDVAKAFLAAEEMIHFAYLFGSVATGKAGPLSDLDFAVYLDSTVDQFYKRLALMEALAKVLKTEEFDLVVLNDAPIVLKHEVISDGLVLKEDRERRVMFETEVLREYLDTAYLREVQFSYLKEKLTRGDGG